MAKFDTVGENMLQRELEVEKRVGVEHYVVGQHYANIIGDETGLSAALSWVAGLGDAVILLCRRNPPAHELWEPHNTVRRAGVFTDKGPSRLPKGFELSEAMVEALEDAEGRYEDTINGW